MNYKYRQNLLFLFILVLIGGFLISHKTTYAYLTSLFEINNNTITVDTWITPTPTNAPTPTPTQAPANIANHIVISEVQIDGGSGNADHDFIELYNPTNSQIDINGYRLVSRTGNSSSDDPIKSFTNSTIIPAHRFYLWARNSDSSFASAIGADASTSASLTNSMSIALRNGPDNTGTIIDALSWNNGATIGEGTNANAPGDNQSLERKALTSSTVSSMAIGGADEFKGNGYDSENNVNDFILRPVLQPQNSTSPIEIP